MRLVWLRHGFVRGARQEQEILMGTIRLWAARSGTGRMLAVLIDGQLLTMLARYCARRSKSTTGHR